MTITLPEELEKLLERAARARGLSASAYALEVLTKAAAPDRQALMSEIDSVRAMTPVGKQTDSAELLRQARDERYGS